MIGIPLFEFRGIRSSALLKKKTGKLIQKCITCFTDGHYTRCVNCTDYRSLLCLLTSNVGFSAFVGLVFKCARLVIGILFNSTQVAVYFKYKRSCQLHLQNGRNRLTNDLRATITRKRKSWLALMDIHYSRQVQFNNQHFYREASTVPPFCWYPCWSMWIRKCKSAESGYFSSKSVDSPVFVQFQIHITWKHSADGL